MNFQIMQGSTAVTRLNQTIKGDAAHHCLGSEHTWGAF